MTRPLACTALVLTLALGSAVEAGALPRGAQPDRCDQPEGARPKRCVGPVTDESGGGGDTLTIVVSVLVGLAVAGIAFVLLRRQLSHGTRA